MELSTFVAGRDESVVDCIASNKLPLGYPNGSKNYTGLRETPLAALERAKMFDDGPVTKHTHVVALTLSPFHFCCLLRSPKRMAPDARSALASVKFERLQRLSPQGEYRIKAATPTGR